MGGLVENRSIRNARDSDGSVMLPLELNLHGHSPHLVALGAHPDDIEIGCGGTLLRLAETVPDLTAEFVLATGDEIRLDEARRAADLFLPGHSVTVTSARLPDGRLPAHWDAVKESLEGAARRLDADVIFAPGLHDAHQDHRLIGELATTVWRDHLVLHYEIPKWDGDLGRPSLYVSLSEEQLQEKLARLTKAYPSQTHHDWFDDEVFAGLARLRGMECRSRYAEAFYPDRMMVTW